MTERTEAEHVARLADLHRRIAEMPDTPPGPVDHHAMRVAASARASIGATASARPTWPPPRRRS